MFTIYLTIINLVLIIIHLYYFKKNVFLIHAYETTINIYLSIFLIIITEYKKKYFNFIFCQLIVIRLSYYFMLFQFYI